MNRRTFLAGTTGGLFLLAGCIVDQPSETANDTTTGTPPESSSATDTIEPTVTSTEPTTVIFETKQSTERVCNGARGISFYGLETPFEDQVWGPSRVSVAFSLGAGAHVSLVVYEDDTVLGATQATAPGDVGVVVDGKLIPLKTTL